MVTIVSVLLLPSVAPLIGMLRVDNLFRKSGVVDRISQTAQNELINIVTIFLGVTVGQQPKQKDFFKPETLQIIALGLFTYVFSTIGGTLFGKLMYYVTGGKDS